MAAKTMNAGGQRACPSCGSELSGVMIGIGANAFYYQQVTGDSGSGARLAGFEGTDIGIGPVVGPVVTLIHKAEKYNFSVQAKWLPEIDTRNRLTGDWVWVLAGVQF
jgi:hypothetical protein